MCNISAHARLKKEHNALERNDIFRHSSVNANMDVAYYFEDKAFLF